MTMAKERSFGAIIAALRGANKMTLAQVAAELGVSVQYVHGLERGRRPNPGWRTVQRLADLFGVSTDDLRTFDAPTGAKK